MLSCTYLLTYLLTYLHSWLGHIKPAISPKRLKIERKLLLTGHKVVHWLSIAAKLYDLEWHVSEIQGHWFLKCSKNGEIQLNNDSDAMYSPLPLVSPKIINVCRTEFYTTNFRSITFIILLNHGIYNVSGSTIRVYLSNDAVVCTTQGLPQSP